MQTPLNTRQLSKYLNILLKVNTALRLLLKLSTICIIISCFLILFFQKYLTLEHEYLGSFIWITIIVSLWAGNLSIGSILITAILHKLIKTPIWPNIKRESILLLVLALSVLIFYVCGVWVYE